MRINAIVNGGLQLKHIFFRKMCTQDVLYQTVETAATGRWVSFDSFNHREDSHNK